MDGQSKRFTNGWMDGKIQMSRLFLSLFLFLMCCHLHVCMMDEWMDECMKGWKDIDHQMDQIAIIPLSTLSIYLDTNMQMAEMDRNL